MKMTCAGGSSSVFEQCVECGFGNLVRFIEDVDLVAVSAPGEWRRGIAQFTNLVDAAVGGGVDLDHVHGIALANLDTGTTIPQGSWLGRSALPAAVRQFSAMARMRAMVVFPECRNAPEKM